MTFCSSSHIQALTFCEDCAIAIADLAAEPGPPPFGLLFDASGAQNDGWRSQGMLERDSQLSCDELVSVQEMGHQLSEGLIEHQGDDGAVTDSGDTVDTRAKGEEHVDGATEHLGVGRGFHIALAGPDGGRGVERDGQKAVLADYAMRNTGKGADRLKTEVGGQVVAPWQVKIGLELFRHGGGELERLGRVACRSFHSITTSVPSMDCLL